MSPNMPVRVLIVDDSIICCQLLTRTLERSSQISVVGTASNGKEAIRLNRELRPDLVTMDIQMPGLDGLQAIEEIMATHPVPILVVTAQPVLDGVDRSFQAISRGALDLVQKPELESKLAEALREKVVVLSKVAVTWRARPQPKPLPNFAGIEPRMVIGIAASTGGPSVLVDILRTLPRSYGSSILLTQHLPEGFCQSFAHWLDSEIPLDAAVARDGETLEPGRVYIAPSNRHLGLSARRRLALFDDPPCDNHRPSGTFMFQSIARICGSAAAGVILSGMGRDGASGLLELRQAGGYCMAQDQASSLVFGMPGAAIELKATEIVLDVRGIGNLLQLIGLRTL